MGRRFGYARVSSDGQDLTAQRNALHAAGCDIIREEKVSGGSTAGREQLAILLDFIAEGDTLVVTKLDRLARSTLDMLTIITKLGERGVKFVSLAEPWANTDNPASKLMLTVMAGHCRVRARPHPRAAAGRHRPGQDQGRVQGRQGALRSGRHSAEARRRHDADRDRTASRLQSSDGVQGAARDGAPGPPCRGPPHRMVGTVGH